MGEQEGPVSLCERAVGHRPKIVAHEVDERGVFDLRAGRNLNELLKIAGREP